MKKLMRAAVLLGILWAILWLTRDRLLPAPPPPAAHPPPFRHPEPAPVAASPASAELPAEAADDLSVIKGIGPVYRTRLAEMSITTFSELVRADSEAVAEQLDVGVASVVDWKTQATEHLS